MLGIRNTLAHVRILHTLCDMGRRHKVQIKNASPPVLLRNVYFACVSNVYSTRTKTTSSKVHGYASLQRRGASIVLSCSSVNRCIVLHFLNPSCTSKSLLRASSTKHTMAVRRSLVFLRRFSIIVLLLWPPARRREQ